MAWPNDYVALDSDHGDEPSRLIGPDVDGIAVKVNQLQADAVGSVAPAISAKMANPMTAVGDLVIGGTAGAATRLAKGSDGQVLKLASGTPAWGTDASGGSGNDPVEYTLASASSAYATTITLDRAPPLVGHIGKIAIDVGTQNCEIREVISISGAVLTLNTYSGLFFAHSSGARVHFFGHTIVPVSWWGIQGNDLNIDNRLAYQRALNQIGWRFDKDNIPLGLDGQQKQLYLSGPVVYTQKTYHEYVRLYAKTTGAGYTGPKDGPDSATYRTNAMTMICEETYAYTADATTNEITLINPCNGTEIPADAQNGGVSSVGARIVFGPDATLPTGIVAGRLYVVESHNAGKSRFKIANNMTYTVGGVPIPGAAIDIGSGSGWVNCNLLDNNQINVKDFYLSGSNIAGSAGARLNGAMWGVQQPTYVESFRADFFDGFGMRVTCQQGVFMNAELMNNRTGLEIGGEDYYETGSFMSFCGYFDVENSLEVGVKHRGGFSNHIGPFHCEMHQGGGTELAFLEVTDADRGDGTRGCIYVDLHLHDGIINQSAAAWFWIHGGVALDNSYRIEGVITTAPVTDGSVIAIKDEDRGIYASSWGNRLRGSMIQFDSNSPGDSDAFTDESPYWIIGTDGREMYWGGTKPAAPLMGMRVGARQTADIMRFKAWTAGINPTCATDGTYTSTSHGLVANQQIHVFSNGSPVAAAGHKYVNDSLYYVRDVATNTFKIAHFPGGPAVHASTAPVSNTIKAEGTGYAYRLNKAAIPVLREITPPVLGDMIDGENALTINSSGQIVLTRRVAGALSTKTFTGADMAKNEATVLLAGLQLHDPIRAQTAGIKRLPMSPLWSIPDGCPSGRSDPLTVELTVANLDRAIAAADFVPSVLLIGNDPGIEEDAVTLRDQLAQRELTVLSDAMLGSVYVWEVADVIAHQRHNKRGDNWACGRCGVLLPRTKREWQQWRATRVWSMCPAPIT